MSKLSTKLIPLALAIAVASPLAAAADTAVTVNGKAIPQSLIDTAADNMAKQSGQAVTPQLKEQIKREMIMREVVVQEAEKQGLDKQKAVQDEMQILRQNVLIRALFDGYVQKHPVTDAQIKSAYDAYVKANGGTEYNAEHILVPTQKDAEAIIASLKKGADFSALAKKDSKDPMSAAHGGELGWSTAANYVKPFGDALAKLKPGQYTTTPVQTQYGWHVIKLVGTRPAKPLPLEQVKPQIEQQLTRQMVQAYQQQLLSAAKVSGQ